MYVGRHVMRMSVSVKSAAGSGGCRSSAVSVVVVAADAVVGPTAAVRVVAEAEGPPLACRGLSSVVMEWRVWCRRGRGVAVAVRRVEGRLIGLFRHVVFIEKKNYEV